MLWRTRRGCALSVSSAVRQLPGGAVSLARAPAAKARARAANDVCQRNRVSTCYVASSSPRRRLLLLLRLMQVCSYTRICVSTRLVRKRSSRQRVRARVCVCVCVRLVESVPTQDELPKGQPNHQATEAQRQQVQRHKVHVRAACVTQLARATSYLQEQPFACAQDASCKQIPQSSASLSAHKQPSAKLVITRRRTQQQQAEARIIRRCGRPTERQDADIIYSRRAQWSI